MEIKIGNGTVRNANEENTAAKQDGGTDRSFLFSIRWSGKPSVRWHLGRAPRGLWTRRPWDTPRWSDHSLCLVLKTGSVDQRLQQPKPSRQRCWRSKWSTTVTGTEAQVLGRPDRPHCSALRRYCLFYKLKVCSNPALSESFGTTFPNSVCLLRVSMLHFGNSRSISNILIIMVFVTVIWDQWRTMPIWDSKLNW